MSDILIFTDIHVDQHRKSLDRLEHCLEALEWVFRVARERSIRHIVFAGDLFQSREKIDIIVYHRTYDIFERHLDGSISLYLLLGNHDLWYHDKWDINSVKPLSALPGVKLIDKPARLDIGGHPFDFIPYTKHPIEHLDELRKGFSPSERRTLIGHLAVHGAKLNFIHNTRADVLIEHDGEMVVVDVGVFEGWDQVFLGHYHGEQRLNDKVEYVGSPLQLSFGEAFQQKHIIVYDPLTGDKEYVVNDFSPQHLIIPAGDAGKHKLKGNFVRLQVDSEDLAKSEAIELRRELQKEGPAVLEMLPVERKFVEQDIKDAKSILYKDDEMLEQWVKQCDLGGMDAERLLEIGKEIKMRGDACEN